jgi:PAS domain S-box-containing protein
MSTNQGSALLHTLKTWEGRYQVERDQLTMQEIRELRSLLVQLTEQIEQRGVERTKELVATNDALKQELTERKLTQETLRASQQQYESLVQSIDGIVWEVDARTFRFTFVSKQAERILGYPVERWLDELDFWTTHLHTDDRDWAVGFCVDATEKQVDHQFEYRMIAADGRVVWLQDIVTVHVLEDLSVRLRGIMVDITSRKQAEDELRQQQEILQKIFDHLPVMICFFSEDGRIKLVNRAWERTRGWSLEEIQQQNLDISAESYPDPRERQRVIDFAAAATGEWADFKTRVRNGRVIDTSWANVRLADGTRIGIGQDITERKRAEVEHAFLAAIVESSGDAISGTRLDGTIMSWNSGAQHLYGYTAAEVIGQPISILVPADRAHEVAQIFEHIKRGKCIPQYETTRVRKDGRSVEVALTISPINDSAGTTIGVSAIARDISARKRTEAELKKRETQLLNAQRLAQLGSWERELATGILTWSDEMYAIWGLSPQHQPLTHAEAMLHVHPDDRAVISALTEQTERTHIPYTAQYRIIRPDGTQRTLQSCGAAVVNASGQAIRLFGTAQDITERKQAEAERTQLFEQVRASREQLQRLSRQLLQTQEAERRHIARELHDEVGQRLTGLGLLLTSSRQLPPDQARLADAQALVQDLMDQVRNLALALRPAILDDFGLVPALVWLFERYTTQTNVSVRFEHSGLEERRFAPDVETTAYRIVQEALTNVARHAGVREVTVRLWTDPVILTVVIEDQGHGFDPQAVATRPSTGLGGMAERAALMGGELTIESAAGTGTRLTAAVPLRSQAAKRS